MRLKLFDQSHEDAIKINSVKGKTVGKTQELIDALNFTAGHSQFIDDSTDFAALMPVLQNPSKTTGSAGPADERQELKDALDFLDNKHEFFELTMSEAAQNTAKQALPQVGVFAHHEEAPLDEGQEATFEHKPSKNSR